MRDVSGNDVGELRAALASLPAAVASPTAIICHTVKGKGIGFAENNMEWHHQNKVTAADVDRLIAALEGR